ncbi:hypothetical protein BKA70DRAFT_1452006 [Coprinopsis sp. MPI-PUGE-AT-0042]|nr:hypothetical protein BKA70DRAFT_1452006 [Coprinopsis sp. MPI-PUGE-AT-0042]
MLNENATDSEAAAIAVVRDAERNREGMREFLMSLPRNVSCDSVICTRKPHLCLPKVKAMACRPCAKEGAPCSLRAVFVEKTLADAMGWDETTSAKWYKRYKSIPVENPNDSDVDIPSTLCLDNANDLVKNLQELFENQTWVLASMDSTLDGMREVLEKEKKDNAETTRRLKVISGLLEKVKHYIDVSRYKAGTLEEGERDERPADWYDLSVLRCIAHVVRRELDPALLFDEEDEVMICEDVTSDEEGSV